LKTPLLQLPPVLAGATTRDIVVAGLGAILGTGLTGLITALGVAGAHAPLIVAPIGASAVLVFAVPSSPLAQPWSVVGGNVISCLVGLAVGSSSCRPCAACIRRAAPLR
jgi:CBS domain-containing membrane protein